MHVLLKIVKIRKNLEIVQKTAYAQISQKEAAEMERATFKIPGNG